jgi:glyoxylase-like metal-dependent hydrolase (beta-lactamase superfamily II)
MTDNDYRSEQLADGVYAIDDVSGESMYLLNGTTRSVLIDTGMMKGSIMPVIEELGAEPDTQTAGTSLLLTHAHIDHMYHADEFTSVYMHKADIDDWSLLGKVIWVSSLGFGGKNKKYDVKHFHPLTESSVIDIGGKQLKVIDAAGHTPGSCIFVDEWDSLLFTGDAVGSGDGAWMWMPGCSCTSEYMKSLEKMIESLKPYADFRFLGGHRMQGVSTPDRPNAHELGMDDFIDMHTLCGEMLAGRAKPIDEQKQFGMKSYLYSYGKSSMWVRKKMIR